jgi:hypothetical protein
VKHVLIVAVVAGLALVGATPAWAVFPGQNGRIAYMGFGGVTHTILPSGHGDQQIAPQAPTPGQWTADDPTWSRDGSRLAFVGDPTSYGAEPDVYTMEADGNDVRRLTSLPKDVLTSLAGLSYSPGGGRIMFTAGIKGGPIVGIVRADDGSNAGVGPGDHVGYVWSPRGEITFNKHGDIWEIRANGTGKHRLIRHGTGPIYSPDGSEFLFRRVWGDGSVHTRLADADGKNVRTLPCSATLDRMAYLDSYSPDARWILAGNFNEATRTVSLVRISLSSCKAVTVVSGALGTIAMAEADWQPLPPGAVARLPRSVPTSASREKQKSRRRVR